MGCFVIEAFLPAFSSAITRLWPTFCSRRETRAQVAGEQRERVREWCGLSLHAQDRNNQSVRAKRCARIGSVRAASSCCSCRTDLQRQADGDEDVAQNGDKDAPAATNILSRGGTIGELGDSAAGDGCSIDADCLVRRHPNLAAAIASQQRVTHAAVLNFWLRFNCSR